MTTLSLTSSISDFGLSRIIRSIDRFIAAIATAQRATNDFERMNARTDAELGAEGIRRADLGRVIFERYFD
ncbi:MAG TPA: hypothetical protein VMY41_11570 [Thermohalobaculum sp.]|nr:hypothetical protein [Thermohalobaculum sp.]